MVTAAIGGALLGGSLLGAGAANADVYYKNCSEARAAGVTHLPQKTAKTKKSRKHVRRAEPPKSVGAKPF